MKIRHKSQGKRVGKEKNSETQVVKLEDIYIMDA